MKLDKEIADKIAREFRAHMNKAARDKMPHEGWYVFSPPDGSRKKKTIVAFRVVVENEEEGMRERLCDKDHWVP